MDYVSLHSHTTFSFLDGYGTPEDHASRVAELEMGTVAVTDHGNVSAHVRWEKACTEKGIKPIFGCEVYAGEVAEDVRTQRKNHLTVLAEDGEGYRNLLRLVSLGWSEGFYYEPTVSGEMLRDHSEGLVVLSGCTASLLATSLVGGKNVPEEEASYARARDVARRMQRVLGDAFYLEVQLFPELESVRLINQAYEGLSEELGIPLAATADVHFCEPDQAELRKILHAVRAGGKFVSSIEQEFDYTVPAEYPHSDKWVMDRLVATGLSRRAASQALASTVEIGQRCTVTLPKIENLRYPLPPEAPDAEWLYRKWVVDGWTYRGFDRLSPQEREVYTDRLKYESELISTKGFVDYFLVVSDAVKFAKRSGIPVGPARGSAAASLVCYLLQITEINPLPFPTLLFERFIDLNRHDLPDIDLDFDDDRRHEVREYLVGKYGADRVGNIGTFTAYKGKNSIDDVARVYNIPKYDVDELKSLLIDRSSGDLRASATIEDTVEMFDQARAVVEKYPQLMLATRLEGNYRGMSVHAAGLVVANGPLTEACAVYQKKNSKGEVLDVVSLDKYDAEYLNVLKLDILGLKTMGMIRIALELIGMTLEELYAIPLDDAKTLQGFRDGDVVGVFQFDGRAMRNVNQSVVPDSFSEVCDINALARPGPLHGGATAEYIDVKHGRKSPRSFGPIVDKITEHTFGQVVYQEQILQVVRLVGEFSWEEAAKIRKIISKKRGEQEFNQQGEKFYAGAQNKGLSRSEAEDLWAMLATAGAYAFNAAHCVSYGMLAWWTMWLKQNHPLEFFVACLTKYGGSSSSGKAGGGYKKVDKTQDLLKDAAKRGLKVMPPDPNKSQRSWSRDDGSLRAGLIQVKGIGEKTADAVLAYREEEGELRTWGELIAVKGIGPKTIQTIQEFVNDPDPFNLERLGKNIAAVEQFLREEGAKYDLPFPTHKSEDVPYERGDDEYVVWLGTINSRNLKDLFENHFSRTGTKLDPMETRDPDLAEWVVMIGEDDTDLLTLTVDRWRYPEWKDTVWSIREGRDMILLTGVKKGFQARRAVYIENLWVLDPEE